MRYVDVLSYHDGTEGPAGVPRTCVEHDGTRALEHGAVRMTLAEYHEAQKSWDMAYALWAADKPEPTPPAQLLPDTLPAWACKAALDEAGMLTNIESMLNEAAPALRWRFWAAAQWHRADIELLGDHFAEKREQLWARAAEIAQA